jgi:hypothetical protein
MIELDFDISEIDHSCRAIQTSRSPSRDFTRAQSCRGISIRQAVGGRHHIERVSPTVYTSESDCTREYGGVWALVGISQQLFWASGCDGAPWLA